MAADAGEHMVIDTKARSSLRGCDSYQVPHVACGAILRSRNLFEVAGGRTRPHA